MTSATLTAISLALLMTLLRQGSEKIQSPVYAQSMIPQSILDANAFLDAAILASPQARWSKRSLTQAFFSWLSGLAARLRMEKQSMTVDILVDGAVPQAVADDITKDFGMEDSPHKDEFTQALATALTRIAVRDFRWGRLYRNETTLTLTTWPLPLDPWATPRDGKVTAS
jgi:hypothetical protein